jgi:hypothetical protein
MALAIIAALRDSRERCSALGDVDTVASSSGGIPFVDDAAGPVPAPVEFDCSGV